MAKIYNTDLPAFIADFIYRVRLGLKKVQDDDIAIIPTMPKTIRLSGEVIIRKDALERIQTNSRDSTITTVSAGTSVDTETRTGDTVLTDETETMQYQRTGTENTTEAGTDTDVQSGGQVGSEAQSGGEIETYQYNP